MPPSDICEKWLNSVLTFLLGKLPLNLCPRFGHKLFKKIIGHFVLNRVDFRIPNTWFVSKFPHFFLRPHKLLKRFITKKVQNHWVGQRWWCTPFEFEASLIYKTSPRTVKATWRNPVSKPSPKTPPCYGFVFLPGRRLIIFKLYKKIIADTATLSQTSHLVTGAPFPSRKFSLCGISCDLEQEWVSSFPDIMAM